MYTLSSNFRYKEVTSMAVEAGVGVEFRQNPRAGLSINSHSSWVEKKKKRNLSH